jgi:signal transduction histidine kinase
MALPVLEFPQWAAAHAARQGVTIAPPVLANLVEAAAVGYLHIRVQDDWFDEAIGEPGAVMMLSDMLFTRAQTLLAREVPQSAFWELFEDVQLGYAEAMLFERRLQQRSEEPYEAVAFQKVLARSRPLVLPPAAVLFLADLTEDVEALERFSAALVTGHQILADLLDAKKDRENGNMTYVLWRLDGKSEDDRNADALPEPLFSLGGFDTVICHALDEVARARQVADALAMPEAARFCEERMRFTTELHARVLQAFFSELSGVGIDELEHTNNPMGARHG